MARQVIWTCMVSLVFGMVGFRANSICAVYGMDTVRLYASSDLADLPNLVDCLTDPGVLPAPTGIMTVQQCLDLFDFNADNDVDLGDSATWLQVVQDCPAEFQECVTGDCQNELACFGNGLCSGNACVCDGGWIGTRCSAACDGGADNSFCLNQSIQCLGQGICFENLVDDQMGNNLSCYSCTCDTLAEKLGGDTSTISYVGPQCECAGAGARLDHAVEASLEYQPTYECVTDPFGGGSCNVSPFDIRPGGLEELTFEFWFRIDFADHLWNVPLLSKHGCIPSQWNQPSTCIKYLNWEIHVGVPQGLSSQQLYFFATEGDRHGIGGTSNGYDATNAGPIWHHAAVVYSSAANTIDFYEEGVWAGVASTSELNASVPALGFVSNVGPITIGGLQSISPS